MRPSCPEITNPLSLFDPSPEAARHHLDTVSRVRSRKQGRMIPNYRFSTASNGFGKT